jgi:alkanesulfonate monooxygenase SsuD/methylene tetrahydromethanopterin reductase-like flavin-dependent oxidoreductase (luciferase family)
MLDLLEEVEHELLAHGSRTPSFATHIFTGLGPGELDPTLDLEPGEPVPLDRFVFAGTPEEVAAQALRLFEAGAARVDFGTPQGLTTPGGVALLADRVLPLLRG